MVEPRPWTPDDHALWARLQAHGFEPPGQSLTFLARLARDHGWSLPVARQAVEEYRRFCFLAMTETAPVTPSEEVDEVWHLHLTYSRDYWERWCGEALGRPLHHQPTAGGAAEGRRYAAQYAATLAAYEARFGPPDPALWPGVAARFAGPRFRTVDRERALVIPLPRAVLRSMGRLVRLLGLAGFGAVLPAGPAAALPLDPFDWPAVPFLTLYVALALAASIGVWLHVAMLAGRGSATPSAAGGLKPVDLAFLAGGARRAADMLALSMLQSGDLQMARDARFSAGRRARAGIGPPYLVPFLDDDLRRRDLTAAFGTLLGPVRDRLVARGMVLSAAEEAQRLFVAAALMGSVAAFGAVKIVVGLMRDRPVGILIALTLATLFAGVVLAHVRGLTTAAGWRALDQWAAQHACAVRAPTPEEVIVAFAVAGSTALVGTALAPYAAMFRAGQANGGSGCGGDGGGGDGGGCGGCGGH